MKFMYSKEFKYFFLTVCAAVLLVFAHAKGWLSFVEPIITDIPRPFVFVCKGIGHDAQSFFGIFSSISQLKSTNAQLSTQNITLEEQVAGLQQEALENQVLKQELGYRATSTLKLISANVIGKDPGGFSQSVVIDSGSSDGVNVQDAVLAQGVFVGRVISTTDHTASVLLLTDPNSSIDAQIGLTGDKGVIKGSFGSGMTIQMISQSSSIAQGDEVLTAGLTDNTPAGLLIGTIGDVQSTKNDLLQEASVVSPVDMRNLSFVAVVAR